MVQDYTTKYYVNSMKRHDKLLSDNYKYTHELSEWKSRVEKLWPQVQIIADKTSNQANEKNFISGETIPIYAYVSLGSLEPINIKVQVYYGTIGKNNSIENPEILDMKLEEKTAEGTFRYSVNITLFEGGEYGYTFRVVPHHENLINPFDLPLIRWVVQ